jgi:hypothetical protein
MTRKGELMSMALNRSYAASDVQAALENRDPREVVETIAEIGRSQSERRRRRDMETGGHRGRMRDHAVMVLMLLQEHRSISISRIAEELGASELTARRWVDCFSDVMPLRLERGIVIVDELTHSRRPEAPPQKAAGNASAM